MCSSSIYGVIEEVRDHQRDTERSAGELREDIARLVAAFEAFLRSLERTLEQPPLSAPTPAKLTVLHGPSYYD